MKSKLKRTIALLLCLVMAMTALPVKKALAAGQITVVSEGNDAFDYFEKYIDGEWSDLHTPKHTILETGEVAYCIQHKEVWNKIFKRWVNKGSKGIVLFNDAK